MAKTYFELKSALREANDRKQGKNNQAVLSVIEDEITELEGQIEDYDLSDDDLFECMACHAIAGIETSTKVGDELHCEECSG